MSEINILLYEQLAGLILLERNSSNSQPKLVCRLELKHRVRTPQSIDRLQIIVVAKKYIYVSQLFISRMPKMRPIPQLVSAPLNAVPIAEHFRRNHPPCEHSCGKHV